MCVLDLLKNHKEIWFIIDDDVRDDFIQEMVNIGVPFQEDNPFYCKEAVGRIECLCQDKSLWHVSLMVAALGWERHADALKINWKRFREGEDYILTESPYQFTGFSDGTPIPGSTPGSKVYFI